MANVRINTDSVLTVAKNIQTVNKQMKDNFSSVQNAITKLNDSWDGPASTMAIGKFNQIRTDFCDNRYNVLNDYSNFLLQQVGQGYEETENVNVSLAAQFK